ncbi:hypothetical protein QYS49_16285 [Marivirga salinae]|uniref:Uncharacterized protein n=1 Tax=Marivirga salinarum TaxID=3059078 RepID=A0AA49JGG6_9BACT|nr:hypothetical protein [Marivirga sp. BDSF4-3]WKK73516.2 hypothetical protein QYS49_16285 [Marivirga sp. BDSF4-3]
MKAKFLFVIILIISASCQLNDLEPVIITDGTYTGFFGRSSPNAKYQASDVTLIFKGNTYQGQSSIQKYPAICRGTFTMKGNKIEFTNECPWTAEFDWTYILTGEFDIYKEGEEIIIQRSYGEETYDTYRMTKQ